MVRVYVVWGDIFKFNYSIADIVYLYLGTDVNRELAPMLFSTLRRGQGLFHMTSRYLGTNPLSLGWLRVP